MLYKTIPGYPSYKISIYGRIKVNKFGNTRRLRIKPNAMGYCRPKLKEYNERGKFINVSILMAITFLKHITGNGLIVDHKDTIKTNNWLNNLQVITQRENTSKDKKNKTSKYTGVSWDKVRKKWKSQIYMNGKVVGLGYFIEEEVAYEAYLKALNK